MPKKSTSTVLTRQQLYEEIWQTPMRILAKKYGLSDRGLAKICARLEVPCPPRGYWSKKAAGKKVVQYKLPKASETTESRVVITPTPPKAPDPKLKRPQAQNEKIAKIAKDIVVPEKLNRPHRLITAWLADHKHKKRTARLARPGWGRNHYMPAPFTDLDRRRHRLLHSLFKALESYGGKVKEDDKALLYEADGETIEFQLREKLKQKRRVFTKEEQHEAYGRKWRQELVPTGKFIFAIKTYMPEGLRREWLETDDQPMETLLADIFETLVTATPLMAEETRKRRKEERQRQIEEQKRYEAEQERKLQHNRWLRFSEHAQQWKQVRLAREFLNELKSADTDLEAEIEGKSIKDWIAWLEAYTNQIDPSNQGVEAVLRSVAEVTSWTYDRHDTVPSSYAGPRNFWQRRFY